MNSRYEGALFLLEQWFKFVFYILFGVQLFDYELDSSFALELRGVYRYIMMCVGLSSRTFSFVIL